ncbi:MAG: serine/threonine-protein kinase, partial [Chloroflexota bacterium]
MSEVINSRYLVQNEIGTGGMGAVYRVLDRLSGDVVALKRVRLDSETYGFEQNSLQGTKENLRIVLAKEFQMMAGLRHPNIISVLDYGFDREGQAFYTMTFLNASQTLLEAAESRSLEAKISLVEQLLEGLAYLHRRGFIHRDIKPENVLVSGSQVKLLDFGLSHREG